MMTDNPIFLLLPIAFITWCLTALVRQYAIHRDILDHPNHRSSHSVPTPRGGGIAVVIMIIAMLSWATIRQQELFLFIVGLTMVAIVGFIDDHRPLPASIRFSVHLIAALFTVIALPLPAIDFGLFTLNASWVLIPIFIISIAWLINLYNFMDGIDGFASSQAISVLVSLALLLNVSGNTDTAIQLILLSAPIIGFLIWNWPKAKIFMGDACSGFLGIFICGVGLYLAATTDINLWCWLILMAAFITDATYTLLTRMLTGQRFSQPHRSHSYQILSRRWNSHLRVTLSLITVNSLWLLPLSYMSYLQPQWGVLITAIAYLPLTLIAKRLKAGLNND
ncbi:MraY family glycosyltransferase [Photobacterium lipolyticum]|uniref:Glycosyl transferase n=1 Tax=Photobacterium lipolyticum TaxID=266810 RepID=A0A2T3MVN3_9GAMM|nr:glycosyltransferase family 4 protein [Photobacterium lipolyticum]PSW03893.1 glycosyl transferase [Photobacterium lipolyticum]